MPRGTFETRHVLHHAWGDFFSELLQRQGVPSENIFVNGQPAYTLYDEPYRRYFATRAELARRYQLDPARRWVFFPENYNWAFYKPGRLAEMQRLDGLDRQNLEAMAQHTRQSFQAVMRWCAGLAQHEAIEVIVRPRPLTPLADFRAALAGLLGELPARLHLNKEESVREWIMASDVVLSSYSTSLIEAGVAGRPAFMVSPLPLPDLLRAGWQQCVPQLTSQAEFEQACLQADGNGHDNRIGAWARRTLMARGDAIANLAAYLARLCRGQADRPPRPAYGLFRGPSGRRWVPDRVWFAYRRRREWNALRRRPVQSHPVYEKDQFDEADIAARVQRWGDILGAGHARLADG